MSNDLLQILLQCVSITCLAIPFCSQELVNSTEDLEHDTILQFYYFVSLRDFIHCSYQSHLRRDWLAWIFSKNLFHHEFRTSKWLCGRKSKVHVSIVLLKSVITTPEFQTRSVARNWSMSLSSWMAWNGALNNIMMHFENWCE